MGRKSSDFRQGVESLPLIYAGSPCSAPAVGEHRQVEGAKMKRHSSFHRQSGAVEWPRHTVPRASACQRRTTIHCKCTTFLWASDKNARKQVSCWMYFARMCFEVVVLGLCVAKNVVKSAWNSAPTRGLRLTNWQLRSDECRRKQEKRGNGLRMRVGVGEDALLSAACGGKGRKSGRLPSESRLIFGKTSGLLPKSPQVFPH